MSFIPRVMIPPLVGETYKRSAEDEVFTPSKRTRNDSDSEDSNLEESMPIKWSAYTLHRLKIKKIESTCPSKIEEPPYQRVERLLNRIISLQNEASPNFAFSPTPSLDKKTLADIQNTGFQIKSFYRTLETISAFAKFFFPVPEPDKKRSEYLIFYYRVRRKKPDEDRWIYDIFAVATGYSWMAISAYRDPNFSFKLAKRIAKPVLYELDARPFFGKKISSSQRWEEFQHRNPLSSYAKWTYSFKTEINSEAVPKELPSQETEQREFRLSVGQGSIRLEQGISLIDIPKWLARFAEILRDKQSQNEDGAGAHFFAFLDFLQPVDQTLAHTLPFVLKREIWQAMHRPDYKTSLRCIPAFMNDYCRADNVVIKGRDIPKSNSLQWSAPQPVSVMIRELSQIPCIQELLKNHPNSTHPPKALYELIDTFSLIYSSGSAKPKKVQWISTLDGEVIVLETGQHYFRSAGRWFTLSMDVLLLVHKDFQDLLRDIFLKSTDHGALSKTWTGKDSDTEARVDVEGIYNNSYLDEPGFLVGDKACPYGIELFDLLLFTETDLYLYQVKEEFGHKTRDASSQITNAAKIVAQAITQNDPEIYALFLQQQKSYCSQGYEKAVQLAGGEDKVLSWLEQLFKKYHRSNIHFVYAFANKTSSGRKLEDELQLKKKISAKDLNEIIPGVPGQELIDSLKDMEFLDRNGYVLPALLTISSKKFCVQFTHPAMETQKAKKKLYDKLNEIVMTEYSSTIARMSLIDACKKVRKLGFTFHICQIPNQVIAPTEEDSPSSLIVVDTVEKELSPKFIAGDIVPTPDGNFSLLPTRHGSSSLLHALVGQKTSQEFAYIPPQDESPRTIFVELLKKWLEAKKENRDYLEKKILELIKSSSEHPALASSKSLIKHLKKKEIAIKELLKSLDVLRKKLDEAHAKLLEVGVKLIRDTMNSFDRGKFLQSVYGAATPILEATKKIQQVLTGPKEEALKLLLNLNAETQALFSGKNESQPSKDFKAAQASKQEIAQKLSEKQQEYDDINILQEYLQCLKDPHYPFLILEVKLAAILYGVQIALFYPEDNEIKKRIFNRTASEIKTLFWRGKKDKVPTYFACDIASEETLPYSISASSPYSLPSHSSQKAKAPPVLIDLSGTPEVIKVGPKTYQLLETAGHGACLLHAILGRVNNRIVSWQGNDEEARNKYAEDFKEMMAMEPDPLIPFLKSLIEDIPNGKEFQQNRAVWASQPYYPVQLAPILSKKKSLIEKNKWLSSHLIDVLAERSAGLAPTDKRIELLFTDLGPLPDTQEVWKKRCHEIRGPLIDFFKMQLENDEELANAIKEVEQIESELKSIEDQLLVLAGEEALWKTYAKVICSSDYWFTESDARIIAHLYGKKVAIYAQYDSGYEPACETMNQEAAESVVVFFQRTQGNQGYHYSQCLND